MSLKERTILVGVTGSIAAFKTAVLVSELRKRGAEVVVVQTRNSEKFVAPLTFSTLSGSRVVTDDWLDENRGPEHVSLADRAALLVVAPATANILGKAAAGIADDSLSTTLLAVDAPVLFAPAMNERMYRHPAVKENIAALKKRGCHFVGPAAGQLACGCEGVGRMAEVPDILARIEEILKRH